MKQSLNFIINMGKDKIMNKILKKEWWLKNAIWIYLGTVIIVISSLYIYGYNFNQLNIWASDHEQLVAWCENNKPLRNISDHPNVGLCFSTVWGEYKPIWEERCRKNPDELCNAESMDYLLENNNEEINFKYNGTKINFRN